MTEQSSATSAANSESKDPSFRIQRIYLKDLSLEQPNAPEIFLVVAEPQVQVEIDIAVKRINDELFEVALSSTLTATGRRKSIVLG
jgi:preprotein translocase subunit SecB